MALQRATSFILTWPFLGSSKKKKRKNSNLLPIFSPFLDQSHLCLVCTFHVGCPPFQTYSLNSPSKIRLTLYRYILLSNFPMANPDLKSDVTRWYNVVLCTLLLDLTSGSGFATVTSYHQREQFHQYVDLQST